MYRVEVAGRIFEGTDATALIKLAVQVRKAVLRSGRERQASPENISLYAQTSGNRTLRLLHKSYAKC